MTVHSAASRLPRFFRMRNRMGTVGRFSCFFQGVIAREGMTAFGSSVEGSAGRKRAWRRGQDSNLQALSGGGFQDRCITDYATPPRQKIFIAQFEIISQLALTEGDCEPQCASCFNF